MTALIAIIMCLYGMVFISFFDVVGTRLPRSESLLGRSHCEHCHVQLRFIDVIPLVGYIVNRGKCASCKTKIPFYHPVIELIGGLVFMTAYLIDGFSISFWVAVIMISVLMIETIADLRYQVVIDRIWMIGIIPLIVIRIFQGVWLTYLISSLSLFTFLFVLSLMYHKVTKKEALGGGDIKLYLFIGWILTPVASFLSLFIGAILGLIYSIFNKKHQNYIPLVPFLSLGVYLSYYFGAWLIDGYLAWLRM